LGRELARRALVEAVSSGLTKLVVEIVAEQGAALALFTELGFTGEALLVDHIRDRNGQLRDLMVLAHHVQKTWEEMDTVGVVDELSAP
jgi:ribosomal protein S18 acetylase RimI-like enzyme